GHSCHLKPPCHRRCWAQERRDRNMNTDDRQLRADPPGTSRGDGATVSGNHRGMRLAMAHHWFIEPRGGERVLAHFAEMFPEAPILTSVATDPADWWPAPIAALRSKMVTGPTQAILRCLAGRRWGEPLFAAALPLAICTQAPPSCPSGRLAHAGLQTR